MFDLSANDFEESLIELKECIDNLASRFGSIGTLLAELEETLASVSHIVLSSGNVCIKSLSRKSKMLADKRPQFEKLYKSVLDSVSKILEEYQNPILYITNNVEREYEIYCKVL